jgi:hypothetical protein
VIALVRLHRQALQRATTAVQRNQPLDGIWQWWHGEYLRIATTEPDKQAWPGIERHARVCAVFCRDGVPDLPESAYPATDPY